MKKIIPIVIICISIIIFGLFIAYLGFDIKLDGESKMDIILNEEYIEPGYHFYWYSKKIDKEIKTTNNIDIEKVGHYVVDYEIKYIKTFKKTREIFVKETEPPVITLEGESITCPSTEYIEEGYKAIDNYDGDITDKVEKRIEDNKITYIVKDSSGNETSIIREIKSEDTKAPVIELDSPAIRINKGDNYQSSGYKATDNCLGDITDKVEISGGVDTSKEGTYVITYKVSDGTNNAEAKRYVSVIDNTIPAGTVSKPGVIYLTFDDGPDANTTPKFLDVLKKYNVQATFFIVPKGDTSNDLIRREVNEGHTVGIHSSSHVYSSIYSSDDALYNDVRIVNEKIKSITGSYSYIYRFPGGSSNTVSRNYSSGIISRTSVGLHNMGYHYFDWNVSSGDAAGVTPPADTIYQNVISGLSKNRPNVVLMHDTKLNSANALENIIKYGLENGYTFESINMSTKEVHHGINN